MDWKTVKVMVTGGAGFVGTALSKRLKELGADVYIFDKVNGQDIRRYSQVLEFVEEHGIEIIYHLAACSQVPVANAQPLYALENNILGTANILEAARVADVGTVIMASTDKAYGDLGKINYQEGVTPLQAEYPYDVSKMCADYIGHLYLNQLGVRVVISRMCNIYGGGDLNWSRLIPDAISKLKDGAPLILRGTGKMVREWLYIDDAVAGYLALADAKYLGAYNFGGCEMSVSSILIELINRLGQKGSAIIENAGGMEIKEQHINDSRAHNLLKWHMSIDLKEGLDRTVDWYNTYFYRGA